MSDYNSLRSKANAKAKSMCYASGGAIHVKQHNRVARKAGGGLIGASDMPVMGAAAKPKLNGKSRIKAAGKKGTTVNITVGHPSGAPGMGAPPMPMPMPHPMPPGPPMAGAAPMGPPRPMAPGMPGATPFKKGGRVKKKADGGATWEPDPASSNWQPKMEPGTKGDADDKADETNWRKTLPSQATEEDRRSDEKRPSGRARRELPTPPTAFKRGGKIKHKDDGGPILGPSPIKKPDASEAKRLAQTKAMTPAAFVKPDTKASGPAMDSDNDATMPGVPKEKRGGKVAKKAFGGKIKETAGAGSGLGRLEKAKRVPHKAGGGSVTHMAEGGSDKMSLLDAAGSGLMDDVYGTGRLAAKGVNALGGNKVMSAASQYLRDQGVNTPDWGNDAAVKGTLDKRDADIDAQMPEWEILGHHIPTGKIARFGGQMAPALATLPFGGGEAAIAGIAERNAALEAAAYANRVKNLPGVREIVKAGAQGKAMPALKAWAAETMPNAAGVSAGMGGFGEGETPLEAVGHGYAAKLGASGLGRLAPSGSLGARAAGELRAGKNIVGTVTGGVRKAAEDVGKVLRTPPETP